MPTVLIADDSPTLRRMERVDDLLVVNIDQWDPVDQRIRVEVEVDLPVHEQHLPRVERWHHREAIDPEVEHDRPDRDEDENGQQECFDDLPDRATSTWFLAILFGKRKLGRFVRRIGLFIGAVGLAKVTGTGGAIQVVRHRLSGEPVVHERLSSELITGRWPADLSIQPHNDSEVESLPCLERRNRDFILIERYRLTSYPHVQANDERQPTVDARIHWYYWSQA